MTTSDHVPTDLAPAFQLYVHTTDPARPPALSTSREQLTGVVSHVLETSGAVFISPGLSLDAEAPLVAIAGHTELEGLAVEVVDRDGVFQQVVPLSTTTANLRRIHNSVWYWPSTPRRLWIEGLFAHSLDDALAISVLWHMLGTVPLRWATTTRTFDEEGWTWE